MTKQINKGVPQFFGEENCVILCQEATRDQKRYQLNPSVCGYNSQKLTGGIQGFVFNFLNENIKKYFQ